MNFILLLVLASEKGEVDISLGMSLEVDKQFVGTTHCVAEIVIQGGVAHEQSECTLVAVELCRHLLHVVESGIHLVHC